MAPSAGAARLRRAIDSGRTGDKVDFPDPAVAPLGTDDEAAGTRPTAARSGMALRQEEAFGVKTRQRTGIGAAWALIAFVAGLGLATLALLRVS